MIEIKLDSGNIVDLFCLLRQSDAEIDDLYRSFRMLISIKEHALSEGDYENAAQARKDELDTIKKMETLLKKKGLFKKNKLEIVIVK